MGHSYQIECHISEKVRQSDIFSADRILNRYFTLFGKDRRGQPLSLLKCGCSNVVTYNLYAGITFTEVSFFVNVIILGYHLTDIDEARFKSFSAFFTGFNQWAGLTRLAIGTDLTSAVATSLREDHIEGFGKFWINCEGWDKPRHHDLDEQSQIRYWRPAFEPFEPISFDRLLGYIRSFQGLLSLLYGGPIGFADLRCCILGTIGEGDFATEDLIEVEVIIKMIGYQSSFENERPTSIHICLRDIADLWPTILSNWFISYDKMVDVFNLYLTVVLAPDLAAHHKFLFLAQAIEGFHRAGSKKRKFSDSEYRRRKSLVLASVPESEKEWLSEALEHSPQESLRTRLLEIIEPLKETLNDWVDDLDSFCENVKRARDYLAHPGNKEKGESDYGDLWKKLRTVLEICFLREVCIDEKVYSIIARRHPFRR